MPVRLSKTISKITSLPNSTNAALMTEFYQYMKNNGASESHINNTLKTNMAFAKFLGTIQHKLKCCCQNLATSF